MIAKSIVDDRLIDLPISSVFWDLLLGRVRIEGFVLILTIENDLVRLGETRQQFVQDLC